MEAYTVHDILGRGSNATVFSATHRPSNTRVAIKRISKSEMRAKGLLGRVVSEVEIHKQVSHDHILQLERCEEDSEYVYLVLEEGECSAADEVHEKNEPGAGSPDALAWARDVVSSVTSAVAYLHAHNILHRDVKLSNVIRVPAPDGTGVVYKLADFGLAARIDADGDERATRCGTPNYMAPEVALALPHSAAADVWALGVMVYTLVVGVPPFAPHGRRGAEATLAKVRRGTYVLPPDMDADAASFVAACLARKPSARPTAAQLCAHPFLARCASVPDAMDVSVERERVDTAGIATLATECAPWGSVGILPNGEVGVEVDALGLVMLVAGDGRSVRVSKGRRWADGKSGVALGTYALSELPSALDAYYAHAVAYVNRVRKKSAAITLHAPLGVFVLTADGRYKATFGDGYTLVYSPAHDAYELDGGSVVAASLAASLHPSLAPRIAALRAARAQIDVRDAEPGLLRPHTFHDADFTAPAVIPPPPPSSDSFASSASSSASSDSSWSVRVSAADASAPPVHVPSLGWAFRDVSGAMHMLFDSGDQLTIPAAAKTCSHVDPARAEAVYSLTDRLPPHVKSLLTAVPTFVDALLAGRPLPSPPRPHP